LEESRSTFGEEGGGGLEKFGGTENLGSDVGGVKKQRGGVCEEWEWRVKRLPHCGVSRLDEVEKTRV
jgi:hypothetical protein